MSTEIAKREPSVRLRAGMHGHDRKVEIRVGNQWHDISHLCSGAVADVSVTEVTTITLQLAFTDVTAEGQVDEATLRLLERFVKEQNNGS